jgi:hypothetical protein
MNKASRKAMCVEVAKTTLPICIDTLEVGKDRLSCKKLAQKLAINESDIIKDLFKKGIANIVNLTLD